MSWGEVRLRARMTGKALSSGPQWVLAALSEPSEPQLLEDQGGVVALAVGPEVDAVAVEAVAGALAGEAVPVEDADVRELRGQGGQLGVVRRPPAHPVHRQHDHL